MYNATLCQDCTGEHFKRHRYCYGTVVDKDLWFWDYGIPSSISIWLLDKNGKEYFFGVGNGFNPFREEQKIRNILQKLTGKEPTDCLGKESDIIKTKVKMKLERNPAGSETVVDLEALTEEETTETWRFPKIQLLA